MFSTLCKELTKNGLLSILNQNEQRVLFAPSNEAFTTFLMNPNILNGTTVSMDLLLYHVTNQLDSPSCANPVTQMSSSAFNPGNTTTQCVATQPVGQSGTGNELPGFSQANFTFPEPPLAISCCNGKVQPISEVLVPEELVSPTSN
jgi:hypothetical protein